MTINLTHKELIELVDNHISKLGIIGNTKISFNRRNQGMIDTSIEILPISQDNSHTDIDVNEEKNTQYDEENSVLSKLIK